jgi:GTP-binding protein Era
MPRSMLKGIHKRVSLLAKKERKLKQIGEVARKEIEGLLESKVFLKLFVRVQKNWTKDTRALRNSAIS